MTLIYSYLTFHQAGSSDPSDRLLPGGLFLVFLSVKQSKKYYWLGKDVS